ncbi:RNA polymerase sigma factor [Algoriphagus limi]|uniref:RNA polymerase sigma factor n=1 Tax=Algoriphagus limi TaxID=2975273 RepID=A0ABT2G7D6_9BACT|nr:RNA polymerase sigma factor [Algoriphagus limi]MCS5489847.1 RNA polymerase sigma factor [Algoriphagus limi]
MNWSDEELIDGCKRQSPKHEELFFKKYYGYVMSISLSYAKDSDLAKEIVHDSFLKFFASIESLDGYQSVKAWLRRITVNAAIDWFRKNKKYAMQQDITEQNEVYHEVHALSALAYEDLIKLLQQLPEDHKLVFNLYEVEGYSHREIGEKLGITESSSRVYLARAKSRLRQLVHIHLKEYAGR